MKTTIIKFPSLEYGYLYKCAKCQAYFTITGTPDEISPYPSQCPHCHRNNKFCYRVYESMTPTDSPDWAQLLSEYC